MQFRVLGSLEVIDEHGRPVDLGGAQQRSVLAMLLIAGERLVPAETIIERLWPERTPASAASTLQSYVSRLRRSLDTAQGTGKSIVWEAPGYRLNTGDAVVDFRAFESAADNGRELLAANCLRESRDALDTALRLWRGPALLEFADQPWARGVATRLDERRLAAIEDRVRADLMLGRHDVVTGELSDLVESHPLREGLWELLVIALYRSGRQAEALRAIDQLRVQLVEGLGVDPSPRIRELEGQILAQDPVLEAPALDAVVPDAVTVDSASDLAAVGRPEPQDGAGRHFAGLITDELVGRRAEVEVLAQAVDTATQRRTQWVLLEGEPGIGKTRLLEHLADLATARGFDVLWGRSYETGASPAFWPWLPPLRGIADVTRSLPRATAELVERLLAPSGDEALLAPVDAGRFRLFEAISFLLQTAAQRRPLLVALDDLQWADPASLELIEFLTGHVVGAPILFAATVRELEIGRNDAVVHALAQVSRRPLTRRLKLTGLASTESAELVRQAIGGDVSTEVLAAIHQRSEGNPFFASELARLLSVEAGLTAAELVRRAAVPAGVRDVIHRRLARLAPLTIELVQVAATLGRDTNLGLLSRAAGIAVDDCLDHLEPALLSRLMVEVPESPGTVRFTHALIREVVLDDMSVVRRARLHLRAADAIESLGHADDHAEIYADHLWEASSLGIEQRAAAAAQRAAEVALRRFAYETADALLERALRLHAALVPEAADFHAELDVVRRLTAVRRVRLGFEQARLHMPIERGKELARRAGRIDVLMELLWTEWAGAATSCDLPTANALSREMVQLAESSGDPWIRVTGYASWGTQCWHEGRIGEAVESMDRAVVESPAVDGRDGVGAGLHEALLLAHGFRVVYHELAGEPIVGGSPLPAIARAQTDPYVELVVWVCEAMRALVAAEHDAAWTAVTAAVGIDVGSEFEFFRSGALCLYGVTEVAMGRYADGARTIEAALPAYQAVGVRTVVSWYLAFLAQAQLALGDLDAARSSIARAAEMVESTGERWEEPYVVATAALVSAAGDEEPDSVVAELRRAEEIARSQGAYGTAARVADMAARAGVALH